MRGKRLLAWGLAAGVLALPAAPASAGGAGDVTQSCVGWYASTNAQEFGVGFGLEDISVNAQLFQPFGATLVNPFAHLELEECQG